MEEFVQKKIRIQSVMYGKMICEDCGDKIKGIRYWVKPDEDKLETFKPYCRYCAGIEKR